MNSTNLDPVMVNAIRMFLPGLTDDDAAELARQAFAQIEQRVGNRLASGLRDDQLEEFEKLIDAGQDEKCAQWLERAVPGYPRVVAQERAAVIAEVVRLVSTDLSAVRGNRRFEEVVTPDLHTLRKLLASTDSDESSAEPDDAVLVSMGSEGPVAVWTEADSGPRRFIVRCEVLPSVDAAALGEVERFRDLWNAACPIVSVRLCPGARDGDDGADDAVRAVAEGGIPLGAGITHEQLSYLVELAHRATAEVIRELAEITAADLAAG